MSNSTKMRNSALKAINRYMTKSKDDEFLLDIDGVESYLVLLSEQWARFNAAQDEVENSCGADKAEEEENARIQAETWYATALSNFKRVQKCRTEFASEPAQPSAIVSASIRLPKMDLPTFAGDSTEWIAFYDAFCSLVDNNAALSGGQKLHYLRSCLKGDALGLISGFKISDANYTEAWNLLKSRYKVMRVIVEAHLRAISEITKVADDTADAIRGVLNAFQQHIRELKALGRPVQFWDDWLVHEIVTKLAFETRKQWELSLVTDEPPTFEQLTTFLEVRSRSLEMLTTPVGQSTQVFHAISEQPNLYCPYCKEAHRIYNCEKFRDLDKTAKSKFVQESKACFNCLSPGHYKYRCNSASACRICLQRHHTLLHEMVESTSSTTPTHFVSEANHYAPNTPFSRVFTTAPPNPTAPVAISPSNTAATSVSSCLSSRSNPLPATLKTVLLSTALVRIRDCSARWQTARVLFDSGSHATFVTEACVQRLGIPRLSSSVVVTGIGSSQGGRCRGETSLLISSRFSDDRYSVDALILPEISSDLPSQALDIPEWPHIRGLLLADPHFMEPGRVDILVGMDVMSSLICPELRKGPPNTPMAQKTVFGWTLCGSVDSSSLPKVQSLHCAVQPDRALTRIWHFEEYLLTYEERICEDLFTYTHQRTPDALFLVDQLCTEDGVVPGNDLKSRYEFLTAPSENSSLYYMPHHPVLQEFRVTKKFRIRSSASAKTPSAIALRTCQLATTADVAKRYRQVCVPPEHDDLHRSFLSTPIREFRPLHVTYGVAAASYFSAAQQTAKDSLNARENPLSGIVNGFYMDKPRTGVSHKTNINYFSVHAGQRIMPLVWERCVWVICAASLIRSFYHKHAIYTCYNSNASTKSTDSIPTSPTVDIRCFTFSAADLTSLYLYICSFICIGQPLLLYEEICSLLAEVETSVNSRSLCDFSASTIVFEAVTRMWFICGEPFKAITEPEGQGFRENLMPWWLLISEIRRLFCRRWRFEYFQRLQRRIKWFRPSSNIEEDVTTVSNEDIPTIKWTLERVIRCQPRADDRVLVLTMKNTNGEYILPSATLPTKEDLFHGRRILWY